MDVEDFVAARVTRIGVKYVAILVLEEHAVPFPFLMTGILYRVVEKTFLGGDFFRSKREVKVEVEICATGGDPWEAPAHPFLVGRQLLVWGP